MFGVAQQLNTSWILFDPVDNFVEVDGFTVGGEDLLVE